MYTNLPKIDESVVNKQKNNNILQKKSPSHLTHPFKAKQTVYKQIN
jgi:hypothetical protein